MRKFQDGGKNSAEFFLRPEILFVINNSPHDSTSTKKTICSGGFVYGMEGSGEDDRSQVAR